MAIQRCLVFSNYHFVPVVADQCIDIANDMEWRIPGYGLDGTNNIVLCDLSHKNTASRLSR